MPWWLWLQVLSLDAPLVAVLWCAALGQSHYLNLSPAYFWSLGLATWIIYLVDRMADDESGVLPTSARHRFCRDYGWWVWMGVGGAGAGLLWLVLNRLPVAMLGHGIVVAMLAALYLAVFAARQKVLLYRLLILMATGMALFFLSRIAVTSEATWWLRAAGAGVVTLVMARLLWQRDRELGTIQAFKEPLAALLFTLGCSVSVHFWTPPEHGILCDETWLLWGLFSLNLWSIAAAERHCLAPRNPLPIDQTFLALALVIAGQYLKGGDSSSLGRLTVIQCVQMSALLLGLLPFLLRRISLPLYHLAADVALIAPLPWLFWRVQG